MLLRRVVALQSCLRQACLQPASTVPAGLRQLGSEHSAGQPHDKISLRGLIFHGYHGVYPEENKMGQKFVVDATLLADLSQAGKSDDLRHTINYAQVYEEIREVVEGPPLQLVEAVAERVAASILSSHPGVAAVTVGIKKPHVAIPGVLHSLGVEITRYRQLAQP